ncbi:MAG TPA: bifunctional phosphopantothenoylcysteine decarboxylase/phosphopantothenate--cysteine ligase CoaBC [Opitutaceae bacterium]|nr:bifunctional phosphopantothenoylcysteine decarboxylase/phosphopantothenate--cysteine ligase CoaBC [Opitutaceae bacterium]
MSGSNILFLVSGSIAAYKACDVVSRLVQRGHSVRVAMTASAQRFVGTATFEGLTLQPVLVDMFEPGRALDHTELTRWAHVTVVCPATANTINRMAAGIGDDLVGAMLLAHDWRKPLLVAPAMNPRMWSHPATVEAVARIQQWGARIIAPEEGRTACGDVGEGRLADPERIVAAIEAACAPLQIRRRILITSGGTSEPLDGIRVLSNRSTGATGAAIARRLIDAGHRVTLLRARSSVPCVGAEEVLFESHEELSREIGRTLKTGEFDTVVHAAAVADFRVESVDTGEGAISAGTGKISSDAKPVIRLAPLPKLIGKLRDMSRTPLVVLGFKLTVGATPAERVSAVGALFADSGADFIVHNDLRDIGEDGQFPATIHARRGGEPVRCATRAALADAIAGLLAGPVPSVTEGDIPC